jgi:uncharacterized protein YqgQ
MQTPKRITMKKEEVSRLVSDVYQEYVTIVYYKDKHDIHAINLIQEEFKRIFTEKI